ncbi:UbiA family prenyltransferase, partial [Methylobacterium soli]
RALIDAFGSRGFDYIGNSYPDLAIWQEARRAYAVRTSAGVRRKAERLGLTLQPIASSDSGQWMTWLKALRVHQYAKNTLVFVPLLTSHNFQTHAILMACMAFVTFSLAASAVYLLNDLMDIDADRRHPTKRNRPFARGALSMKAGMAAIVGLFALAIAGASQVSTLYLLTLIGYIALTTAYSLFIKRKMIIDIVVLAMLYTVRVVAGAVAIDVVLSEWLLTFSMFVFTSLALIKRYTELAMRMDNGLGDPTNRNYRKSDLTVIGGLAAATGMNAVTVFALYLSSPAVTANYGSPKILWAICPLLVYVLGRMLVMAHRRDLHDDPVVFALRDRVTRLAVVTAGALVLIAL